ncbi:MAG: hypothetical protein RSD77_03220 [Romboutsia sp.]
MNIISRIYDNRINSENVFIEIKCKDYLSFSQKIIDNNELQRKRVKSSKTVYSLLKDDLKEGCIIPPIVLAISDKDYKKTWTDSEVLEFIQSNIENLLILDGLQRTYTILLAEAELIKDNQTDKLDRFYNQTLRLEVYLGINKFGILYRMLTLNTGQTPMSIRHQIEILYKDIMNKPIEGIKLISETDDESPDDLSTYNFRDIIEGFNSYLERNELPLGKSDILQNIKSLEKLSFEDQQEDLFEQFTKVYNGLVVSLDKLTESETINSEKSDEYELDSIPFGKNVIKIFNKSQALTGFGAAIGKLKDFGLINNITDLEELYPKIKFDEEENDWMYSILKNLDSIKTHSKKIGNSQRMYFQYFFRELFNKESDSYLNLDLAVENGYKKYYSQVS